VDCEAGPAGIVEVNKLAKRLGVVVVVGPLLQLSVLVDLPVVAGVLVGYVGVGMAGGGGGGGDGGGGGAGARAEAGAGATTGGYRSTLGGFSASSSSVGATCSKGFANPAPRQAGGSGAGAGAGAKAGAGAGTKLLSSLIG
jgi:hypothetical protein